MNKKHIAVAGSILVDEINTVSAYPKAGELTKILSCSKSVGGLVPNVGIDLKRIMPELTVSAIGKIGNDENGEFVKGVLQNNGINTDMIVNTNDKTSFTQVISVSGGQRKTYVNFREGDCFGEKQIMNLCEVNVNLYGVIPKSSPQ